MFILGIETSGLEGSVAIARDAEVIAERRLATTGRRHAQTLLAEIDDLLRCEMVTPAEIAAVAVGLGPGSFTGLRVGVVCAKTWAYATGCQVAGVETFATFAVQSPSGWQQVWVIGDAQRGDFFAAEYRRDESDEWTRTTPIDIVPGVEWLAERTPAEHIIGPGVLRANSTPAGLVREDWAVRPSASIVAQLGARRLAAGKTTDVWTLAPIYIRPSAAEEKRASG